MKEFLTILAEGTLPLLGIGVLCFVLVKILIGPPKTKPRDRKHPIFGQWTRHMPNVMSFLRFPLGAWIFIVFAWPSLHHPFFYVTVHLAFAFVAILDFLDGMFARKWHAITEEGKSLDPAADKVVTFFLGLTGWYYGELPGWAFTILIAREIGSMVQRWWMSRRGIDVSARWLGKIKTVVQFTVLYIILLRIEIIPGSVLLDHIARLFPDNLILWATIFMCFITIISLFPFFQSFSYVNNYELSQRAESNRAWYIVILPNLLTIGNYLCGITAVFFSMPEVQVNHRPFIALFWILAAALCDALDGPLARRLKAHSEFGGCLDSSTDLSTFGLAVAVVIFLQFSAIRHVQSLWGLTIAVIYFMSVHLRLARFTRLHEIQENQSEKENFVGLPSPSGALGVLILFTFFENIVLLSALIILLSILMYSRFEFISHSNAIKNKFYRYLMMPIVFGGFSMLLVLIFQQPFISMKFSRELHVYFNWCSWILTLPLLIYIADGLRRPRVDLRAKFNP